MILRSAMDVVSWQDAASRVAPVGSEAIELREPAWWIGQARTNPVLAQILIAATFGSDRPSPQRPICSLPLEEWARRFAARPPWLLVDRLLEEPVHRQPASDSICLARLARGVACETGWTNMERAYWSALLLKPHEPIFDPELARCLNLAQALASFYLSNSAGRTVASKVLENYRTKYPHLAWSELHAQAQDVVEHSGFTGDDRVWTFAAKLNSSHQQARLYRYLVKIASAADDRSLLDWCAIYLAELVTGDIALWIGPAANGKGMWFQSQTVTHRGTLADFQQRLPGCLRVSWEPNQLEGLPVRLYLERPPAQLQQQWFEELAEVLRSRGPGLSSACGWIEDAKESDNVERQLRDRLREAIKEFSAGAAHEIHNPLGTIAGKAQRLLLTEQEPSKRDDLQKILQQVNRIHRMIRDLHLVGRGGFGNGSGVLLADAMHLAMQSVDWPANVNVAMADVPNVSVKGDVKDVARAISEIIKNAIEVAMPAGRVDISFTHEEHQATIAVQDTGRGFSSLDYRHAFDPFYSGRSAGRGLGMGLTVAQSIIEALGGTIAIRSSSPTLVEIVLPTT